VVGSGFGSRRYATWQVAERAYGPVFHRSGPQGSGQVPRGSGVWGRAPLGLYPLLNLIWRFKDKSTHKATMATRPKSEGERYLARASTRRMGVSG
jgi:hypothetical protein